MRAEFKANTSHGAATLVAEYYPDMESAKNDINLICDGKSICTLPAFEFETFCNLIAGAIRANRRGSS